MPIGPVPRRDALARMAANRVRYVSGAIAFNTANVANGVSIGTIPANSFIVDILAFITTVFNAGTTNVVQVGRSGSLAAYATGTDTGSGVAGAKRVTTGLGSVGASDVDVLVSYTQTGGAATTGAATIYVGFINPNPDAGGAL